MVVEIGPGRGALTEPLLERASRVVAIELDPVLVQYLRQKFRLQIENGTLELVEGDVLKAHLGAWGRAAICGNLPYYITSPILERVFAASDWERAVLMVQAEVASRIAAAPGSRDYGYLSVLAQVHARVERLLEVPRSAFRPVPKVDSAVLLLEPRNAQLDFGIDDLASFLKFSSVCFRQKRKTLRNNLSALMPRERLTGIRELDQRAEQLGIAELASLQTRLGAR